MQCTTCDERLPDDAMFCPNCGRNITSTFKASAPQPSAPYAPPPAPQTAPAYASPLSAVQPATQQGAIAYAVYVPPRSTAAVISLVFGILAWSVLPVVGALVAVFAGHIARREIQTSGGALSGDGMALAGLVLGYVQLVPLVLFACLMMMVFGLAIVA